MNEMQNLFFYIRIPSIFPLTLLIRAAELHIFLLKSKALAETHIIVFRNDILNVHCNKQSVF
jgi:hypothetical protein